MCFFIVWLIAATSLVFCAWCTNLTSWGNVLYKFIITLYNIQVGVTPRTEGELLKQREFWGQGVKQTIRKCSLLTLLQLCWVPGSLFMLTPCAESPIPMYLETKLYYRSVIQQVI